MTDEKPKLSIDANGAPDGKYGPFYVMSDVIVKDGVATIVLSEDARVDGYGYKLMPEKNKMFLHNLNTDEIVMPPPVMRS